MEQINITPLSFQEFNEICKTHNRKPSEAVNKGFVSRDDLNNLARGRWSQSLGRCLFFFVYMEGLLK